MDVVDLGFEVSEGGGGEIRWDLGGIRQHCGVGSARQEHPGSDHTAPRRPFFRRCGRPSFVHHTSVGTSCKRSRRWLLWWCTSLQLHLASAASEARGAGALQGPPGLWKASPGPRALRRPPLWQGASCSPPPTSVFCPRCLHLGKSVKKKF